MDVVEAHNDASIKICALWELLHHNDCVCEQKILAESGTEACLVMTFMKFGKTIVFEK